MEPSIPEHPKSDDGGMNINLDRGRRIRGLIGFWLVFIAVAGLLGFLLERFTGSRILAYGMAGGMLAYMLIASSVTYRNLSKAPGDGRLD